MDTRFSAAIHTLILISESLVPLTSEQIAASVGTNPSYIRRLTGLLKKRGILESRQGVGGFALTAAPEELTLLAVYQAIAESDKVHVFDLHQNPNDACLVGRHIKPVLAESFREIEEAAERALRARTLADCIARMRAELDQSPR